MDRKIAGFALLLVPIIIAIAVRLIGLPGDLLLSTLLFVILFGGLLFWKKKEIRAMLLETGLPKWALFFLSAMSVAVLEENFNCPMEGCSLFPFTLVYFSILFAAEFAAIKFAKITDWRIAAALFGAVGWYVEFITGSWKEMLWASPLPLFAFLSVWVFAVYSLVMFVPAYVYLNLDDE